jgi:hypothetical protein
VLDELVARYRLLVDSVASLTVVYDAGQNSRDNHALVEQAGIGFVGSLPRYRRTRHRRVPKALPGTLELRRQAIDPVPWPTRDAPAPPCGGRPMLGRERKLAGSKKIAAENRLVARPS